MNAAVSPPLSVSDVDAFELLPLSALKPGDSAVISTVASDSACARRLLSLGFVPGSEVKVLRRAPMGDPTEYEVHGTRFGLRRLEAAWIQVQSK